MSRRRPGESGFALMIVFAMAAAIAIALYMEMPRIAFEAQRQKEQLLIERGDQYKRAIQVFFRANGRRYPAKIEDLESYNGRRYLRKRFIDPMTGKDEWRLVHVQNGMLTDSVNQQQKKAGDQKTGPTSSYISEAPGLGQAPVAGAAGGGAAVANARRRASDSLMPGMNTGTPVTDPSAYPNPTQDPANPQAYPQVPGYPGAAGQPGATGATGQIGPTGQAVPQGYPAGVVPVAGMPPVFVPQGAQTAPPVPGQIPGQPVSPYPGQQVNPYPGQQVSPYPGQQVSPYPPGVSGPNPVRVPFPGGVAQPGVGPGPAGTSSGSSSYISGNSYLGGGSTTPSPTVIYPGQQPGQQLPGMPGAPVNSQMGGVSPYSTTPGATGPTGQNSPQQTIHNILMNPRPGGIAQQPQQGQVIGGGIAGVASTAQSDSIMLYSDHGNYNEWEFIYDPAKERRLPDPRQTAVGTPVDKLATNPYSNPTSTTPGTGPTPPVTPNSGQFPPGMPPGPYPPPAGRNQP